MSTRPVRQCVRPIPTRNARRPARTFSKLNQSSRRTGVLACRSMQERATVEVAEVEVEVEETMMMMTAQEDEVVMAAAAEVVEVIVEAEMMTESPAS